MRDQAISMERISRSILMVRRQKVLLDADLADLYGVETRVLNQSVRRNIERFPADFMFQLTPAEANSLRSQFVILETGRGRHRKFEPYAFTEYDGQFAHVFEAIRQLVAPPKPGDKKIGFRQPAAPARRES